VQQARVVREHSPNPLHSLLINLMSTPPAPSIPGIAKTPLCCCTATGALGTISGFCFPFPMPCFMDLEITGDTARLICYTGSGFSVQWNGTAWTVFEAPCGPGPYVVLSGSFECMGGNFTMSVNVYDESVGDTWQMTVP